MFMHIHDVSLRIDVSFCIVFGAASDSWLASVMAHGTGTHLPHHIDVRPTVLNCWARVCFEVGQRSLNLACHACNSQPSMCTLLEIFSDSGSTCRSQHQAPGPPFTGHWHCRTTWPTSQQSQRAWPTWLTLLAHSWAFCSAEQMLRWCPPSASCLLDICTPRARR